MLLDANILHSDSVYLRLLIAVYVLAMMVRWMARDNKHGNKVGYQAWHYARKDSDKHPQKAQHHWVYLEVLAQSAADTCQNAILIAPIESFWFHIYKERLLVPKQCATKV